MAADAAGAARQAVAATGDVELPDVETYHTLVDGVKQGQVPASAIDDAVRRLLRATRPILELKGFQRSTLPPGERRTLTFEIGPEQLAYHGPERKRVVEPGRFQILVGGSSAELKSGGLDVAAP